MSYDTDDTPEEVLADLPATLRVKALSFVALADAPGKIVMANAVTLLDAAEAMDAAADEIERLRGFQRDALDSFRSIGIALGLPDPWGSDATDEAPEAWKGKLSDKVLALRARHDQRVTELLEANNREVDRRRAAEHETGRLTLGMVAQGDKLLRWEAEESRRLGRLDKLTEELVQAQARATAAEAELDRLREASNAAGALRNSDEIEHRRKAGASEEECLRDEVRLLKHLLENREAEVLGLMERLGEARDRHDAAQALAAEAEARISERTEMWGIANGAIKRMKTALEQIAGLPPGAVGQAGAIARSVIGGTPSFPEDPYLAELLRKSADAVKNMSPDEREEMFRRQRESWARGEAGMAETSVVRLPDEDAGK